ncbi:hypothetical protein K493DRAFT_319232 [Basidiobolus meristosporus CBS 931.73]|uniref:Uncharacterized protein n=1 Tax=Basidiobolus meristosporus CBS 931.73 TaxID=1314790 RepID=A0A1Y1XTY9_9FUNG|nr:hypothetical protein K493DRAFT_319232 [Basidiobolus meristosporus CBS 931.73]|eukprot:ORX88754.1 hypothetical protein K493DRAFT_319232 [Basidiobolus meristosporus CBS 931.73]
MPYTSIPKPPESSELIDDLSASAQYWTIREKEMGRSQPRNSHYYAGSTMVTPHQGFPYQPYEPVLTPQHEYYGAPPPPFQPSFQHATHQDGYNYWNQQNDTYGYHPHQNSSPYFPQPSYPARETPIYYGHHAEFPQGHFQESSEPHSGYPLRMPDPLDYISSNHPHFAFEMSPYYPAGYEHSDFMTIPDPRGTFLDILIPARFFTVLPDYQVSQADINPYDPALLPIAHEGLLRTLQSKRGIGQNNEYFNCFSGHEIVVRLVLSRQAPAPALTIACTRAPSAMFLRWLEEKPH